MATAKLYLKNPSAEKITRVQCILSDGRGVNIKILSDISINPKHWSKKQRVVLSANRDAVELNKYLESFRAKVYDIYLNAIANGIKADAKYIRTKLSERIDASEIEGKFWSVWGLYLNSLKESGKIALHVKAVHVGAYLQSFEAKRKQTITFESVKLDFLEGLQNHMNSDGGLSNTTSSNYLDIFKIFLTWAVNIGHNENTSYKSFKARRPPKTGALKAIYEIEDLEKIKALELKEGSTLDNVRSLILLSVYTGFRYSDYIKLNKEHIKTIKGVTYVQKRQEKTKEVVTIPIVSESAKMVLDRIIKNGFSKRGLSHSNMNVRIKELCKMAELNEEFIKDGFSGAKKTTKIQRKYEIVTTHTGRRTFATNMLLQNVSPHIIMKMTGHKSLDSFWKYINVPKSMEMDILIDAMGKLK